MEANVIVDTSMTLSAMSASLLKSIVVSAEARTILTFGGKRCRNNSLRKELESAEVPSLSPRSCCIRQSNCVGLWSPSSSPLMSCCNFHCSEAAVRLTNSVLRMSYESSVGGFSRSRTSVANSGLRELTM